MKYQPSSQTNLIRAGGYSALGQKTINPIGFYQPDVSKFIELWTIYDINQNVSKYDWDDLPNGLEDWNLERMLYFRGSVAGFKFGGKVYILPWVMNGGLNTYGKPFAITPITFNGCPPGGKDEFFQENFNLPVDVDGDEISDYEAVLLYDNVPTSSGMVSSRYSMNQILIKEIANTFARVNINIVVSNKKILLQIKDPKQAEVVRKELELIFSNDCPFGIITTPFEAGSLQSTSDFNADELFNVIKNYDGMRTTMSGLSSKSFGNEKKERLVTGQLVGQEDEKDLILDEGLKLRQNFCELCNKKFGTHMSVRKHVFDDHRIGETDVNGLGLSAKEEVEDNENDNI